jgi:hypothetical protein
MSGRSFLFVNAGEPSGSAKGTDPVKSFVMRKVRAHQPWSTKSRKAVDKRKYEHKPGAAGRAEMATRKAGLVAILHHETTRAFRRPSAQLTPSSERDEQDEDKRVVRPILARLGRRNPGDAADPFGALALNLDTREKNLLVYCEYSTRSDRATLGSLIWLHVRDHETRIMR